MAIALAALFSLSNSPLTIILCRVHNYYILSYCQINVIIPSFVSVLGWCIIRYACTATEPTSRRSASSVDCLVKGTDDTDDLINRPPIVQIDEDPHD